MKMGNILSPWRYDVAADHARRWPKLRPFTIQRMPLDIDVMG
jgi:hypothetical protein